jgi:hypothetical protein
MILYPLAVIKGRREDPKFLKVIEKVFKKGKGSSSMEINYCS